MDITKERRNKRWTLEVQIPVCPTKGKNHVMHGSGVQTMQHGNRCCLCDERSEIKQCVCSREKNESPRLFLDCMGSVLRQSTEYRIRLHCWGSWSIKAFHGSPPPPPGPTFLRAVGDSDSPESCSWSPGVLQLDSEECHAVRTRN